VLPKLERLVAPSMFDPMRRGVVSAFLALITTCSVLPRLCPVLCKRTLPRTLCIPSAAERDRCTRRTRSNSISSSRLTTGCSLHIFSRKDFIERIGFALWSGRTVSVTDCRSRNTWQRTTSLWDVCRGGIDNFKQSDGGPWYKAQIEHFG
jgi:hypothetical protein